MGGPFFFFFVQSKKNLFRGSNSFFFWGGVHIFVFWLQSTIFFKGVFGGFKNFFEEVPDFLGLKPKKNINILRDWVIA